MRKAYGKVKVRKAKAGLDDIPEDCGYMKRFKYDIDMHSNGVMGECITWCQENCKGKWGWYFEGPVSDNPYDHRWEEQDSYMSFEDKKEAMAFFLAIGIQNIGDRSR